MHTSDQSSEEKQEQLSQQPLYEFPPDYPSDYPAEEEDADNAGQKVSAQSTSSEPHPASDEAIRQGLVYPPPPSFYMKVADPENLEDNQASHSQPAFSSVPPLYAPGGQGYPPGLQQPPFAPPQAKRSRKWIWIVVAVLSVGLLGGCGLCGWAFYNIFGEAFSQATSVTTVVTNYYDAIEAHDYARAYSYVSPQGMINGMTQQTFTQQAQSYDNQFGSVTDFTPQSSGVTAVPSSNSTEISSFSLTVQVTRAKKSYNVLLTLHKVNGQWKITDFDRI
ncbi:MAG TPA: hypothetical protein VFB12_31090 [Ktedonobacteraceae bacterium]|nr:hypothetical protein [Ktedonobacteraceae bacterium]